MTFARRKKRAGISLAEVLVVITIVGVLYMVVSPRIADVRSRASLRAARQELVSAFAAARSSAMQKGKPSTLTLTSSTATVSVLSGLAGTAVQIYSVGFDKGLNSSLSGVAGSPMTVSFDAHGLLTGVVAGSTQKYRLLNGTVADTLCISAAGVILSRSCQL